MENIENNLGNINITRENMVEPLMEIGGYTIEEDPEKVSIEKRELAISLIFEELSELVEASGISYKMDELCKEYLNKFSGSSNKNKANFKVDKVEQLDGLADLQYVVSWAVNTLGHSKHFEEAYAEVSLSNSTKACKTIEEAKATVDYYMETKEVESTIYSLDSGGYAVKQNSNGKVLKSINYIKANFEQFFN